jgi:transcriptional regulator with XRE-family HTH domain
MEGGSVQLSGEAVLSAHVSPILLRQEIGRRLKAAREATGLGLEQAAPMLDTSPSTLSRIENGTTVINVHLVRTMMDVYDQRLDEVVELVRAAKRPGWWKAYGISNTDSIALETGARLVNEYQMTFLPGLLQTSAYARALFRAVRRPREEEWIDNQLAVRTIRQERLTDEQQPLMLDAVIHEYALCHPVGGPDVMRAQLRHLVLITELPTVTLRVLPASMVSNEALVGGFTVLDFPADDQPAIAHLEHAFGSQRTDRTEQVWHARLRFDHLRSMALHPDDSVALIEQVAEQVWSNRG